MVGLEYISQYSANKKVLFENCPLLEAELAELVELDEMAGAFFSDMYSERALLTHNNYLRQFLYHFFCVYFW